MSDTVHSFDASSAFEKRAAFVAFWRGVFGHVFGAKASVYVDDVETQKRGIDWVVVVEGGRSILIDTKARDRPYPGHDAADVLLEYWSDRQRKAPGWMEKESPIDFVAYAWMPSRTFVLFSWPILRSAWLARRDEWIRNGEEKRDGFMRCTAINSYEGRSWATDSVAVPLRLLNRACVASAFGVIPSTDVQPALFGRSAP